jgi:hypothetical protein
VPKRNRRDQIKHNLGGNKKHGKHPGNTPLTAPLTTPQAHHMAGAEARSEYGPTIRAAKQEAAGSRQRQQQIGQWFGGLQGQIDQTAQATDASYAQANNALLAHAKAAADAGAAAQGQVAQSNLDLTKLTGADPSLTTPALAEGAAAAGQRTITNEALAAPILQSGASQASFLRNTGINAGRESIEQRGLESKRRMKIKEDLTALHKERSQKAVGNFRDIRGEERDYGIQRNAFGLEKKGLAQDAQEGARNRASEERRSVRSAEQDERASMRTARTSRKNSKEGNKGGGGNSEKREGRENALATVNSMVQANGYPKNRSSVAELERIVAEESEVSAAEAKWAVQRYMRRHPHEGTGGAQGGVTR